MTLSHGRVVLRPLRARDESDWYALRERNAAWTGPWDATRPPEASGPELTFRGLVRSYKAEARAGRALPWALAWLDDYRVPQLCGQLTISGIAYGAARWGMAGYWVAREVAGRGIAPTALALGCDYAFSALRLHRIEVAIRPENANSLRVVEKLGFRFEGQRPEYMHVNGAWCDHLMFALHSDEVPAGGLISRVSAS